MPKLLSRLAITAGTRFDDPGGNQSPPTSGSRWYSGVLLRGAAEMILSKCLLHDEVKLERACKQQPPCHEQSCARVDFLMDVVRLRLESR